jgi:hypothetical protein
LAAVSMPAISAIRSCPVKYQIGAMPWRMAKASPAQSSSG